jgi:exonuclease SbcD
VNHADRSPGELFAEYCASKGVADDRVQALFAQLHDRITSTGFRG